MAAPVTSDLLPLFYALILLRSAGRPCVFWPHLYGFQPNPHDSSTTSRSVPCPQLPALVLARKLYAYGPQSDYGWTKDCIAFVRLGTWDRRHGCAVVMSIGGREERRMSVGREHSGEVWMNLLEPQGRAGEVVIDAEGCGIFECAERSVTVWVDGHAARRKRFIDEQGLRGVDPYK
ncbi:hypothetical protein LTR60_002923, partial [Cryomyces antarcticus]